MAYNLAALASLFEDHWGWVETRCRIREADLKRARALAFSLVQALGPRATTEELSKLRDTRDRAGRFLQLGVDELRAAATYVHRRESDPLERYPGVYVPRARSRRPSDAPPAEAAGDANESNASAEDVAA